MRRSRTGRAGSFEELSYEDDQEWMNEKFLLQFQCLNGTERSRQTKEGLLAAVRFPHGLAIFCLIIRRRNINTETVLRLTVKLQSRVGSEKLDYYYSINEVAVSLAHPPARLSDSSNLICSIIIVKIQFQHFTEQVETISKGKTANFVISRQLFLILS